MYMVTELTMSGCMCCVWTWSHPGRCRDAHCLDHHMCGLLSDSIDLQRNQSAPLSVHCDPGTAQAFGAGSVQRQLIRPSAAGCLRQDCGELAGHLRCDRRFSRCLRATSSPGSKPAACTCTGMRRRSDARSVCRL